MTDGILADKNGDHEAYLSSNIEDYLLSLADSLQQVQRELNRTTIAGAEGTPSVRYQLPKLEFELKMSIEMAESKTNSTKGVLKARSINALNSSSSNSAAEAASTIKGTFVAVPVDGGKPPVVVVTRVVQGEDLEDENVTSDPNLWSVYVQVQSAVGQRLEGVEVQFNIDRQESFRLSSADGIPNELSRETDIRYGLMTTDKNGNANNVLEARPTEQAGAYIVLLIDVLGRSEVLVFKVGEQAFTPIKETLPIITQLNRWLPDDRTLFGIASNEEMKDLFVETLPEAMRKAIEQNDELRGQLEKEFAEKYDDIRRNQLSALLGELASWLIDLTNVYSDTAEMRAAFAQTIDPADEIALLVERDDLWSESRLIDALDERFDQHRQEQVAEVRKAFNGWTVPADEHFVDTEAMKASFLKTLAEESSAKAIGQAPDIWATAELQQALVDKYDRYFEQLKTSLIASIDGWPMGPNQRDNSTDMTSIQAEFYKRTAKAVEIFKELPASLLESLNTQDDVRSAFQRKLDNPKNP